MAENSNNSNLVEDTKLELNSEAAQALSARFKLEDVKPSDNQSEEDDDDDNNGFGSSQNNSNDDDDDGGGSGNGNDDDSNSDDEIEIKSIEDLIKVYNIEENDELLEGIDLKDSSPKAFKEFYERRSKALKEEALKDIVESDEDVADLLQWKASGKSTETWRALKQAETFEINIEEDDIEGHENFLRQVYEQKGFKGKKLDVIIEALKDSDELITESKQYQNEIKAQVKQQAQEKAKQEELAIQNAKKEEARVFKEIDTIVKKGVLRNSVEIPKNERAAFQSFILSEERQKAWSNLSLEDSLFIDYMLYKKFELKALPRTTNTTNTSSRKGPGMGGSKGSMDREETISLSEALETLRKNKRN